MNKLKIIFGEKNVLLPTLVIDGNIPKIVYDNTSMTDVDYVDPINNFPETTKTMNDLAPRSELRVYSRRKFVQSKDTQQYVVLPSSKPCKYPGNIFEPFIIEPIPFTLEPIVESAQIDEPIAIRKGVCECTKHPLCKHISYAKLSPKFKAFTTSITDDEIPKFIHEA